MVGARQEHQRREPRLGAQAPRRRVGDRAPVQRVEIRCARARRRDVGRRDGGLHGASSSRSRAASGAHELPEFCDAPPTASTRRRFARAARRRARGQRRVGDPSTRSACSRSCTSTRPRTRLTQFVQKCAARGAGRARRAMTDFADMAEIAEYYGVGVFSTKMSASDDANAKAAARGRARRGRGCGGAFRCGARTSGAVLGDSSRARATGASRAHEPRGSPLDPAFWRDARRPSTGCGAGCGSRGLRRRVRRAWVDESAPLRAQRVARAAGRGPLTTTTRRSRRGADSGVDAADAMARTRARRAPRPRRGRGRQPRRLLLERRAGHAARPARRVARRTCTRTSSGRTATRSATA